MSPPEQESNDGLSQELAHKHGPDAIEELARLATKAESEAARVAAYREILDRAYGKAMQPIQGTMEYGVFQENAGNALGAEIAGRAANGANGQKAALMGHGQAHQDCRLSAR